MIKVLKMAVHKQKRNAFNQSNFPHKDTPLDPYSSGPLHRRSMHELVNGSIVVERSVDKWLDEIVVTLHIIRIKSPRVVLKWRLSVPVVNALTWYLSLECPRRVSRWLGGLWRVPQLEWRDTSILGNYPLYNSVR